MALNLTSERFDIWSPRGALRWVALSLAVVLAIGSGVALVTDSISDEKLPGDVALRINGDDVTKDELDARIDTLQALYGVKPPAEDDPTADSFRRDAAKSFVIGWVVEREAERRGIKIPAKRANAELSKIVAEQLAGDRRSFARVLGDIGITEDDVLEEITRTMATSQLHDEVIADVPDATLEEARAEFDARRDKMRAPEKRRLSNIVVETQEDAEAVMAELAGGASFAEVAAVSSLDASTKDQGGDLGAVESADLDPSYAAAAFAAEQGTPFGPVQSEFGWNVGLVTAVQAGEKLSFAEVKATLVTALTTKAQSGVWQEFLSGLLDDADVNYADAYRPADPDGLPSELSTQPTEGD